MAGRSRGRQGIEVTMLDSDSDVEREREYARMPRYTPKLVPPSAKEVAYMEKLRAGPRFISEEEMEADYINPSQNIDRMAPLFSWVKPEPVWPPARKPITAVRPASVPRRTMILSKRKTTPIMEAIRRASQSQKSQTQLMTGNVRSQKRTPSQRYTATPASQTQPATGVQRPDPPRKRRLLRCVYGEPSSSQPRWRVTDPVYAHRSTASQGDIHPIW